MAEEGWGSGWFMCTRDQALTLDYEREKAKALKDSTRILVVAARNFVHDESGDQAVLEALIQAVDMMPWTVLDDLGIPNGEDDEPA